MGVKIYPSIFVNDIHSGTNWGGMGANPQNFQNI